MPTPSPTPAVAAPPLAELTASLAGKRALGADDAMAVRRAVYAADATISREEAEALVALNDAAASSAPEWKDLYVEALTDYVVYQQDPRGYVDEDRARWLMAQVARDGRIKTGTELELLIHVLERADAAPADLAGFVLDMVRRSILAERPGRPHPAIQAADVERLRRVVYAAGGPDNVAVTRAEAEALLDLNDAVRGAANDPAWTDFFARAVGDSVMAACAFRPQSREDALKDEAWLAAPERTSPLAMLAREVAEAPQAFRHTETIEDLWRERNDAADAARAAAGPVTAEEAAWLAARIGHDGVFDDNEKALIAFIAAEAPAVHAALKPLLDKAAGA